MRPVVQTPDSCGEGGREGGVLGASGDEVPYERYTREYFI